MQGYSKSSKGLREMINQSRDGSRGMSKGEANSKLNNDVRMSENFLNNN